MGWYRSYPKPEPGGGTIIGSVKGNGTSTYAALLTQLHTQIKNYNYKILCNSRLIVWVSQYEYYAYTFAKASDGVPSLYFISKYDDEAKVSTSGNTYIKMDGTDKSSTIPNSQVALDIIAF